MPIRPLDVPTLAAVRPGWLTAGLLRLGLLALFVVLVGMVRVHLTRTGAAASAGAAGVVVVAGIAWFLGAARRVARALPFLEASQRRTDAVLAQLRRIGLPLLGLAFFVAWAFVYVALWAIHPGSAFAGLPASPRFADFFYYAVTTAFISPPGDLVAHSRGARTATMIEMLTAFALLTTYISSFVDWHGAGPARREPSPPPPPSGADDELAA